jgi:hypothetical protein
VRSAAELRAQIERGDLSSHPAWEDAIEWEWLETYIRVYTDLDQRAQNDEIHRRDAEFAEFLRVSRRSLRLCGEKKMP